MKKEGTYSLLTEEGQKLKSQPLYNILSTDKEDYIITTILDFHYDGHESKELSLVTVDKEIFLKEELIEIKNDDMISSIEDYLNNEFIRLAEIEGEKNKVYDIDYKELLEKNSHQFILSNRTVVTKLNFMSFYIATEGRIGKGDFLISNEKTNKFILNCFDDAQNSNNFKLIVDKGLEDGKIIMGRKNDFSQPGIILILNENSFKNIVYKDNKQYVNLIYSFSLEGLKSEKQYLIINIKNKF